MFICFTIETDWLISVAEEARRMLNSGTLLFPWIYHQHSCEMVSNSPHCLILTKRSKFLHLLSASLSRHHQTVMQSYKCIVLRQANNLPFPECPFFTAMHWSGTVPLCDEGVYTRAYRHHSVFSCDSPRMIRSALVVHLLTFYQMKMLYNFYWSGKYADGLAQIWLMFMIHLLLNRRQIMGVLVE